MTDTITIDVQGDQIIVEPVVLDLTIITGDAEIVLQTTPTELVVEHSPVEIVIEDHGMRGPQGDPGPPGSSAPITLQRIAAVALGGHRVVLVTDANEFNYASASTLSRIPVGITTGASNLGALATALTSGSMTEPSWSWTPGGDIFLGELGVLTQTPPTNAAVLTLGRALSATVILVDIEPPIMPE